MNYTEMLNKIIKNSNLPNKEILEKLKEKNISITPNYLSVIKNDKTKFASEEVSTAIAEICGCEFPKALSIQGYIDKAPEEIKSYIETTTTQLIETIIVLTKIKTNMTDEEKNRTIKILEKMSSAELICYMNENKEEIFSGSPTEQMGDDMKIVFPERYAIVPMSTFGEIQYIDKDQLKEIL